MSPTNLLICSGKFSLCRSILSSTSSGSRRAVFQRRMTVTNHNQQHDSLHSTITSFAIGSFAGLLGSFAGMGGGFVMIPLMTSSTLLLRLSQHTAHGTSLFAVTATGIAGALGYGLHDVVEVKSALTLAAAAMMTARMGALYSSKVSEQALKKSLGIFMICVAPIVPAKSYLSERYGTTRNLLDNEVGQKSFKEKQTPAEKNESISNAIKRLMPFAIIGLGSGFASGLFGVGGGAVVVPALTVASNMTHHEALGTSLLAMSLPAIVGTFTHFQKGNVALRVAIPLSIGAFIGAFTGGKMCVNISEEKLRYGFSGLMVSLGVRALVKA